MKKLRFVAEVTLAESRYLEEVRCRSCCGGATLGAPSNSWCVVREVSGGDMGNRNRASEDFIMGDSAIKFQVANKNSPGWVV